MHQDVIEVHHDVNIKKTGVLDLAIGFYLTS